MSTWRATEAKQVYPTLLRRNFTFCFHDSVEIGPAALAKIAKDPVYGLKISD